MHVHFSKEAQHDLESAVDYLAVESSRQALRLLDDLETIFRFLANWPNTGHGRPDLSDNEHHRFWSARGYLIGYDPTQRPLTIVCVIHGSRDAASILAERWQHHEE